MFKDTSNFVKEYDFDHLRDRLYIHWDLLSVCNFKCSYCYARRDYLPFNQWNKLLDYDKILRIIEIISLSKLPVFLGLLGGEPTLHPRLKEIVSLIKKKILDKHDKSRLYITSNLSKNIFSNLEFNKKIFVLGSCHVSEKEKYGENFKNFFNSVETILDKGFKLKINIPLNSEKKFWGDTHYILEKLRNYNVNIHPHFLYSDGIDVLENYNEEFYNEFKECLDSERNFVFETKDNVYHFNDYEIFKNDICHFKGWRCYQNNYEISWDGIVRNLCKDEECNLFSNPLFFRNLKVKPIICKKENCLCDGLLKTYKEKISD